jgi:hypothetical protein
MIIRNGRLGHAGEVWAWLADVAAREASIALRRVNMVVPPCIDTRLRERGGYAKGLKSGAATAKAAHAPELVLTRPSFPHIPNDMHAAVGPTRH